MDTCLSQGPCTVRWWSVLGACLVAAVWGVAGCQTYPECGSDSDCAEYNADEESEAYGRNQVVCVDHICRQCRADSDCQAGFGCRDNACAALTDYCDGRECIEPGVICVNGMRHAGCSEDCPCPSGMACRKWPVPRRRMPPRSDRLAIAAKIAPQTDPIATANSRPSTSTLTRPAASRPSRASGERLVPAGYPKTRRVSRATATNAAPMPTTSLWASAVRARPARVWCAAA
jgi:hypothetical protein